MRQWIMDTTLSAYAGLLPIAWVALAVVVFVLVPLAVWSRTRSSAGVGLVIASYVFGATTWFLGAGISFASFGWFGLIVGLMIMGIGVVPIGIIGAYFSLNSGEMALSLLVMGCITFGTRVLGAYCVSDS